MPNTQIQQIYDLAAALRLQAALLLEEGHRTWSESVAERARTLDALATAYDAR